MLIPRTQTKVRKEPFQDVPWQSHFPFFFPIGKDSISSGRFLPLRQALLYLDSYTHLSSLSRLALYAGAPPGKYEFLVTFPFLLDENQQSSIRNLKEVLAKAEWEILYKRIPRGSLESSIRSYWDTEASKMLKLRQKWPGEIWTWRQLYSESSYKRSTK